jgi:hypothetical protein
LTDPTKNARVREKVKIGKDDMDVCGCRDYDVAVFGGGKKISLYFEF